MSIWRRSVGLRMFAPYTEFLLDISLLFTSLSRLIGFPVLWVLLIGSYKPKSFISSAQTVSLGSVLNESDKGVLSLTAYVTQFFFPLCECRLCPEKTNYSTWDEKYETSLTSTVLNNSFARQQMSFTWMIWLSFAGVIMTPDPLLFTSQKQKDRTTTANQFRFRRDLENVFLNERDTLFAIHFSRWQRMRCELWWLRYPLPCHPRRQSVCLRWQPASGEEQCHLCR